jgi:hypothetical protein
MTEITVALRPRDPGSERDLDLRRLSDFQQAASLPW